MYPDMFFISGEAARAAAMELRDTSGFPAVTAGGGLPAPEGNGEAVDFRDGVARCEHDARRALWPRLAATPPGVARLAGEDGCNVGQAHCPRRDGRNARHLHDPSFRRTTGSAP